MICSYLKNGRKQNNELVETILDEYCTSVAYEHLCIADKVDIKPLVFNPYEFKWHVDEYPETKVKRNVDNVSIKIEKKQKRKYTVRSKKIETPMYSNYEEWYYCLNAVGHFDEMHKREAERIKNGGVII